ncbi:MAG: hypothetical protein WKF43_14650, partial [Acidimicrobiales bacterium]
HDMKLSRTALPAALAAVGLIASLTSCTSGSSATSKATTPSTSEPLRDNLIAVGQPVFRTAPGCGTYDGQGCAPPTDRIDLDPPTFSNPTEITNPLFPISELGSAVLLGVVDGKPFRSETTLLPSTGTVVIEGKPVEVRLSQYAAYLDGRITEVAVDRYAQADDGSVWYLGEDVYDYDKGTVVVSEGTWLAGRDGPPAMIMPADPQVGQVFRPEDIPGIVFEEVTIKEIGQTVDGPLGKVEGAIVAEELHLDGTTSDKVFAPGYGEFYSAHEGDEEALALAIPADGAGTPEPVEPVELAKVLTGTWGLVESARLEDWEAVDATLGLVKEYWATVGKDPTPNRVADALDAALVALTKAAKTQKPGPVTDAAVEVAQSALDLELRHRSTVYVDLGRLHLHAQQLRIDAAAGRPGDVAAEVATLEWIRDRISGTFTAVELQQLDDDLAGLRAAATTGNLATAADQAARLANLARTLSLP